MLDLDPKQETILPVENYAMLFSFTFSKDKLIANTSINSGVANLTAGVFNSTQGTNMDNSMIQVQPDMTEFFYFDQRNDFCTNQSNDQIAALWDGLSCKGLRSSPRFLKSNEPAAQLLGRVKSFQSPQTTIDFWFRVNSSIPLFNETQNTAVLFKNYINSTNGTLVALINIYLAKVEDSDIPVPICDTRFPSDNNVSLMNRSAYGVDEWMHIACIINNDTRVLHAVLFNGKTFQENQANLNLSLNINVAANTSMMTYIGNNLAATTPFLGLIRELRILKQALTIDQVRSFRTQKLHRSYIENFVINQYSMSAGYQSLFFESAFTESNTTLNTSRLSQNLQIVNPHSGFQWEREQDLVICPVDTIFNGECCSRVDYISPNITYLETESNILVFLSLNSSVIESASTFNWTLLKINGNNPVDANRVRNKALLDLVLLSQRTQQNITLPLSMINLNSSYLLNVRIQSPHLSRNLNLTYELFLTCPRASIANKTGLIVHQWGYETKIFLTSQMRMDCYPSALTTRSISWTHNNTLGVDPWSISPDRTAVTFNREVSIRNDTILFVNFTVVFSNGVTITDSRLVQFLGQSVILNLENDFIYLPDGSNIVIDASNTQFLINTVPSNELGFQINCPDSLINNTQRDCVINQNGTFIVPYNNIIRPIPYTDYFFTLSAGKLRSAATASRTVRVRFFSTSNDLTICPGVQVQNKSIEISRLDLRNWSIQPTFFMDCLMNDLTYQRYNRSIINYTLNAERITDLNQSLLFSNFSEVFDVVNDGYQIKLKNENTIQKFRPGDIIPIIVYTEMLNPETQEIVADQDTFELVIKVSDIVVVSQISQNYVTFEEDLIINASLTFDPDFSMNLNATNTSVIAYQYFCNGSACPVDPTQLRGGILKFTLLDRIRLGYLYNTNYTFEIVMNNYLVPSKSAQNASYVVQFSPPTNGSHKCPRSFYYNRTQNNVRFTQHIYNTVNVTDYIYQIGFEPCDSLPGVSLNYMLVEVPKAGLVREGQQMIMTNPNNASFQLMVSGLLSQIGINENITIRTSTIFNYTAAVNVRKIGYSVNDLVITRGFSTLNTVLSPNNTKGNNQYVLGLEEILFLDGSQSFDPDAAYLIKMPQQILLTYQCSPALSNICSQFGNQSNVRITKRQRMSLGLNNLNGQFWVSLTMKAAGRTSNIVNQTYSIGQQDTSRCYKITDTATQVVVEDIEENPRNIVLRPNYLQVCEDAIVTGDMIWSSNGNPNQKFWIPQSQKNTSVLITLDSLLNFTKGNKQDLSVSVPFTLAGYNKTLQSTALQYQIIVNSPRPKAFIEAPSPINLYGGLAINITAGLLNSGNTTKACYFICQIGDYQILNCANSTQCTFDILPVLQSYQEQMSLVDTNIIIYAEVANQGKSYNAQKALSFVQNDQQPQCTIEVTQNINFLPELATIFRVACQNFKIGELSYKWSIQNLDYQYYANDNDKQLLKVKAFALQNINPITVSVKLNQKTAKDNAITVRQIFERRDTNFTFGAINIYPSAFGIARLSIFQLSFTGFVDNNGGPLYYQVKYNAEGQTRFLTTKTTDGIKSAVLPMTDRLIIEIYDQYGNYQQRNLPLSLNDTPQMSDEDFIANYTMLTSLIPNNMTNDPTIDTVDYELGLNTLLQLSYILKSSLANLTYNETQSNSVQAICGDIINRTAFLGQSIRNISLSNDTRANALLVTSQIYFNCYFDSFSLQISTLLQNFTDDAILDRGDDMALQISLSFAQILPLIAKSEIVTIDIAQDIVMKTNKAMKTLKQKMANGESLSVPSQKSILKKFTKDDIPETGVNVINQGVQFTLPTNTINNLTQPETYVNMQIVSPAILFDQANNTNLTLAADIIYIELQDIDMNEIPVKGQQSIITFTDLNVPRGVYSNLVCGYFDFTKQKWLIESEGELSSRLNTVNNKKSIECTATHLSTFSVFQIQDPYFVNAPISTYEDDQRVIVNAIQAILMALAIVLFLFQVRNEKTKRDAEVKIYNFTKLESRMKITTILGEYSKVFSLFQGVKIPFISRLLIFINYLLWVSLYILCNFAITRESPRSGGDMVYLIVSLVVVFVFSAPFFKHYFIVVFYKFKQIQKFSNIFQQEIGDHSAKSSVKSSAKSAMEEPARNKVPINDVNINKDQKEQRLSIIYEESKNEELTLKKGNTDIQKSDLFDTSNNQYHRNQTGHDSDLEALKITNVKSPRENNKNLDNLPMDSEFYVSSGERGKMTKRNLQQISKDIKIKQIPKGGTSPIKNQNSDINREFEGGSYQSECFSSHFEANDTQIRNFETSSNMLRGNSPNELREFEGGSDEEGGLRSSKRLKSSDSKVKEGPGENNKGEKYKVSEAEIKDKKPAINNNPEYSEAWEVNSKSILFLQILVFIVIGALNGFLFFWISIDIPMQLRGYIAALIISLAAILLVLDTCIAVIASKIITSKGIQGMNIIQLTLSLGFIGFDMIKAIDINTQKNI